MRFTPDWQLPIGLRSRLAELRPNPHYPPSESCAFDPPLNPLICVCAQPPSISTAVGGVVGIDGTFRIERSARVRPDRARVSKVGNCGFMFWDAGFQDLEICGFLFWAVNAFGRTIFVYLHANSLHRCQYFSRYGDCGGLRRLHNKLGWLVHQTRGT